MSKYTRPNKINHYHDNNAINHHNRHHHYHIMAKRNISKMTEAREMPSKIIGLTTINRKLASISPRIFDHESLISSKQQQQTNISNNNYNSKPAAFFGFTKFLLISTIFLLTILSVILLDHQVHSLNCYHCSSVDNPSCDESFTGRDNFSLPADTDCLKHINREAKVCRKIVQYIEHKKVVIRSCGYIDEPNLPSQQQQQQQQQQLASGDQGKGAKKPMCYKRSGTFAIMMESCNCYTDNCNHSTSLKPIKSVLFLSSCFIIVFLFTSTRRTTTSNNR